LLGSAFGDAVYGAQVENGLFFALGILALNKQKNKFTFSGIILGSLLVLIIGIALINALT
jgi:hypothetical protein